MNCCPAILLPGNALLFICFCFAQPGLDWDVHGIHTALIQTLAPQKAGSQIGHVDVGRRERGDSHHYSPIASQQKNLLAGAGPWDPQSDSSHFSLYLLLRTCLLPTDIER